MRGQLFPMRKLLLLLPLFLGCSLLRQAGSSAFERPTLSFKEARLPEIDFKGAELDLVFLVTNPNPVGLDLTRASYNLEVEGHKVASGTPKNGLKIPGGGTTEVTFPAKLQWNEIAPALEAVFAMDQVRYKASGELGLGPVTLPLQHEGTFAGATVGRIALPEAAPVPAKGESTVTLPLNVSFLQSGAAAAQAIRSGVAEVKIDAILNAAGASIPVKVARTVQLQRTTGSAGP